MKRIEHRLLLAGLLALGLAACSSTGTQSDMADTSRSQPTASTSSMPTDRDAGIGDSTTSSYPTAGQPATTNPSTTAGGAGTTSSSAAGTGDASSSAQTSGSATTAANSTVTSIEVVQRPQAGTGTVAGAAVGGTVGSDRVYRVTLRMDDGRTQTITQEWAPTFSTGDRVRMVSGAIQR